MNFQKFEKGGKIVEGKTVIRNPIAHNNYFSLRKFLRLGKNNSFQKKYN